VILKDDVTAAIRRAFQLGQTYWQQADSESYKENKKADATRDRYNALCIETAEIAARADTRIAELETAMKRQAAAESLRADAERWRKGANYWRVKAKSPAFHNPMLARPTDEQFIAIHEAWLSAQGIVGNGAVFNGMAIYDAVCEVITKKDGN